MYSSHTYHLLTQRSHYIVGMNLCCSELEESMGYLDYQLSLGSLEVSRQRYLELGHRTEEGSILAGEVTESSGKIVGCLEEGHRSRM